MSISEPNSRALSLALTLALTCAGLTTGPFAAHAQEIRLAALGGDMAEPSSMGSTASADDSADWDELDDWFEDSEDLDEDRFERFNRAMFAFNQGFDRFVFNPFTHGYRLVVPKMARNALHNAFLNLDSPVVMVNALLQGRGEDAGDTFGRLVLNSSVGLGGLIDVAAMQGTPRPQTDFGETLAYHGRPRGAYLVLPVLGPTTLRDGIGRGVDVLFQPLTYLAGPLPGALVSAGRDLTRREQEFDGLQALQESSVDFYAALRSAYLQDLAKRTSRYDDDDAESTPSAQETSEAKPSRPCARRRLPHGRKPAARRSAGACNSQLAGLR